ncbi:MAG TPA: OmpH family outer membrane protein [Bacteroidia bacterium]|jgi:outer membrane protein|nr:OmpH family outer membrane protein [Bacteroidia bacterium]
MNRLFKTIAALLFVVGAQQISVAQKMAHVQLDSLIQLMPETKQAMEIAQAYLKDLEKQVASMKTEFDTKYQDYLANEASYSDLVKKTKQEELQTLNQRIQDFQQQAQQDYQKKYVELSKPIQEKAKKAVDAVAKENGYKYVLDTSTGIVLYSEASDDILLLVKKKMETMPPAVLPGTAPKKDGPKPQPKGTTGGGTGK